MVNLNSFPFWQMIQTLFDRHFLPQGMSVSLQLNGLNRKSNKQKLTLSLSDKYLFFKIITFLVSALNSMISINHIQQLLYSESLG